MLLVIDNYDSFTYNLVQLFYTLGAEVAVYRNDKISVAEMEALRPTGVVISPGGGAPADAGVSGAAVRHFGGRVPVLGICLGHQVIAETFGATVARVTPRHGKVSEISHDGAGVFTGLAPRFQVMRYHSLAVMPGTLPDELVQTAAALDDEVIMGVRHKSLDVEGVQFHPESIMTYVGKRMLANFACRCAAAGEQVNA